MLGIFSGKSDHPLADPKSARELFDRLNRSDPMEAIDEIDSWLESTGRDEQIKPQRRIELLFHLDDIGSTAARKLAREYLLLPPGGRGQSNKLWQANRKYWHQLAASYRNLLQQFDADKKLHEEMWASLPAIYLRLLRAYRGCIKWDQFRYGPIDPSLWLEAGKLYLQAEKNRWLEKKLNGGDASQTTIESEYLLLLLFQAASMDRLQPPEIELAEQLLVHFLPDFSLTRKVRPENVYWVDAAKATPPTRLAKLPEVTPTLRFFATANALSAIETMRSGITTTQTLPKDLGFGHQFGANVVIAVLHHLAAFCSPQPPMRSHTRLQVKSRMKVVSGFQAATTTLHGDEMSGGLWEVEDVSRGGVRAQLVMSDNEGLNIGSLVAMRPDGGENWLIGIVRRISRENHTTGRVGIETVGKAPSALRLDSSGLDGDGLLLDAELVVGGAALLVVTPGVWQDFRPVSFEYNADHYLLRPLVEQERGNDYVIGRYWVETL